MSAEERLDEVRFRYIFPEDYNPVYANGVHGGLTPRGEVVMNFFLERLGLPYSQTHDVRDQKLGKVVRKEPEQPVIVRYVTTGVVLTIDNAKTIHKWLGDWIDRAERAAEEATKAAEEG